LRAISLAPALLKSAFCIDTRGAGHIPKPL
jgi:hypothetical protein